jgi:hypothetical protein
VTAAGKRRVDPPITRVDPSITRVDPPITRAVPGPDGEELT